MATLTVLINADEELSSPGSRSLITKLGAEHDATFSVESSRAESDKLSLATSGIASITLTVKGRASHAGSETGGRCERAVRARSPGAANARSFRSGGRAQDELDDERTPAPRAT